MQEPLNNSTSPPSTHSITSDEVNYLIYRYLQESGFVHAAYVLASESHVTKCDFKPSQVAPGALVLMLQRGLHYFEMECHLNDDGTERACSRPFSLVQQHVCDESQGSEAIRKRREPLALADQHAAIHTASTANSTIANSTTANNATSASESMSSSRKKERSNTTTSMANNTHKRRKESVSASAANTTTDEHAMDVEESNASATNTTSAPVQASPSKQGIPSNNSSSTEIPDDQVLVLQGHASEVFICAWHPTKPLLASGSGDGTARLWDVSSAQPSESAVILRHTAVDVTTLDWNNTGEFLATGSYDGHARVWRSSGELVATMKHHQGPVFSLKWNRQGNYLLSGSVDRTAIVWDAVTGSLKQQFAFHQAPTLDVDWRNNDSFATCSTDKKVYVCQVGQSQPLSVFEGHSDEVNAIKWDPSGTLLASCSDDGSAKIWSMAQSQPLHDLREHAKEIYTVKWSPTGPGTEHPNASRLLASASFDTTIKLWDVETGHCLSTLSSHTQPVYSVAFSPDGQYLASGSFDQCLHLWHVPTGRLVRTYRGRGGIFEVSWERTGLRVAACTSKNTVCVVDVRRL